MRQTLIRLSSNKTSTRPQLIRRIMAQNLPPLANWEQISTNIVRILGGNPSKFTLQGSNTYLLGQGPRRILIDTAQGDQAWIDNVRDALEGQKTEDDEKKKTTTTTMTTTSISTALLTHWHPDHIGGVKDLEALFPDVKVYKHLPEYDPKEILDPKRVIDMQDGQRFRVDDGGIEIQAIHSPGHAKDHMAFIITESSDVDEVGCIFTADNVLGHGTAVFEDLALYLDSLALMKRRVQESAEQLAGRSSSEAEIPKRVAYPGHGIVIPDAVAKIDEYIAHRRVRELEILNVLKYGTVKGPASGEDAALLATRDSITTRGDSSSDSEGSGGGGDMGAKEITAGAKEWTGIELVKVIYRNYPPNLFGPAEYGVVMVLEKLKRDGKALKTEEGKWRVIEKATL